MGFGLATILICTFDTLTFTDKNYYSNYADMTVMMVDSSKFDETFFYELLAFEAIDFIITDKKPGSNYLETAKRSNMEFLY